MGINPPKGVILYGQPGTGKTLMAKAVAASTNSTFIPLPNFLTGPLASSQNLLPNLLKNPT